jgi:hypothetical protein
MMALGKTIRIYLTDGSATGPIVAEVINWTGQVVVVPRAQLHELAGREELQRTGVYCLVGPDAESNLERVYVGEADEVYSRLRDHDRDEHKEFWTRAVTVTSKDLNLTKAHGRYLESRIIELANRAGKVALDNGTSPATKTLPESDRADMEYFLEQLQLVLPVLGFDFLRPAPTREIQDVDAERSPLLAMDEVGIRATAREIDGRFVVLKDSTARAEPTASFNAYAALRDALMASNKLVSTDNGLLRFSEDVEFSSPSAGASVVVAGNRNGRLHWKLESTGETYAEWKERQVEQAERAKAEAGAT